MFNTFLLFDSFTIFIKVCLRCDYNYFKIKKVFKNFKKLKNL